jgi:hypothetical protein
VSVLPKQRHVALGVNRSHYAGGAFKHPAFIHPKPTLQSEKAQKDKNLLGK